MSGKTVAVLCTAGFLSIVSLADQETRQACCLLKQKTQRTDTVKAEKLKCSLTGKVVDRCCCVERDGKTHCTLARKDVESCCCSPVKAQEKDTK